jgi:hypothetical protein
MLSLAEGPGADLCGAHDEPLRVGVGGALPAIAERQLPPVWAHVDGRTETTPAARS